jgi:hypothetical protein
MIDPHTLNALCQLYPLDKSANADGQPRRLTCPEEAAEPAPAQDSLPPLLRELLAERLGQLRDLTVGAIAHSSFNLADFHREMGDLFGTPSNTARRRA